MSREREELFDHTLKYLYDRPDHFVDLAYLFQVEWNMESWVLLDSITDELKERGWVQTVNKDNYRVTLNFEGRQMLEKYGSYSSFSRFKKRRRIWSISITRLTKVATIITTALMLIFAGLSYRLEASKDKLEKENKQLKQIIDSINTKKPSLLVSKKDSIR